MSLKFSCLLLTLLDSSLALPQLLAPADVPIPQGQSAPAIAAISAISVIPVAPTPPLIPSPTVIQPRPIVSAISLSALENVFNGVNVAFPTSVTPVDSILASVASEANQLLPTASVQLQSIVTSVLGGVTSQLQAVASGVLPVQTAIDPLLGVSVVSQPLGITAVAAQPVVTGAVNNVASVLSASGLQVQLLTSSILGPGNQVLSGVAPTLTNVVNDINSLLPASCVDLLGYVASNVGQLSSFVSIPNVCQPSSVIALITSSLLQAPALPSTDSISQLSNAIASAPSSGNTVLVSLIPALTSSLATALSITSDAALLTANGQSPSTCTNIDPTATDVPPSIDSGTGLLFRSSCGISEATVAQCPYLCSRAGSATFQQCMNNNISGQEPTGQFPPILCTHCLPPCSGSANGTKPTPPFTTLSNTSSTAPYASNKAGDIGLPQSSTVTSVSGIRPSISDSVSIAVSILPTALESTTESNSPSIAVALGMTTQQAACENSALSGPVISSTLTTVAMVQSLQVSSSPQPASPVVPSLPTTPNAGQYLDIGSEAFLIPLIRVQLQGNAIPTALAALTI